jgi:hypothetical protein
MKVLGGKVLFYLIFQFGVIQCQGQSLDLFFKKNKIKLDSLYKISAPLMTKFNVDQLPLFCKWDEKWQESSAVAVRFRLGNLETVNKMEGK